MDDLGMKSLGSAVCNADCASAFGSVVGRFNLDQYPDLECDAIDLLDQSCQLDPVPCLGEETRRIVTSGTALFGDQCRDSP